MPRPMRDSRGPAASEDARWTIGRSGPQSSSNPDILYGLFLASSGQMHTLPPPPLCYALWNTDWPTLWQFEPESGWF